MQKSVSCPLSPKSAISVKVFPTWWPIVQSKHSSSCSCSIRPQALREPQGGTKKKRSRHQSLKTEGKLWGFSLKRCLQTNLPQGFIYWVAKIIFEILTWHVIQECADSLVHFAEKISFSFCIPFFSALDKCLSFGMKQSDVVATDINPCLDKCVPPLTEPFYSNLNVKNLQT